VIDSRTVFTQNAENISPVEDFNRALIFCCPRLFWCYNVLTRRTLSPHAPVPSSFSYSTRIHTS